ncbi:putative nuclease HARBI1 [Pleurodeles waltl]|uniref:putative nuclease HARBI1 n=1 Tax=Pleurodeles waltl TaxID=8319 RepID=UPI0037098924
MEHNCHCAMATGDSAYAVQSFKLTTYLSPATLAERRYNAAYRTTRNDVERTFGLLKSCFRCIHKSGGALQYSPEATCKIVATCAMLHNIATTRGIPVEPTERDSDEDGHRLPPLHPVARSSAAEAISDALHFQHGGFKVPESDGPSPSSVHCRPEL